MKTKKIHMRNSRLFVNGGMCYPQCYSHINLLDIEKSQLKTTGIKSKVTCKRCLQYIQHIIPQQIKEDYNV